MDNQYYPTPPSLAKKMWSYVKGTPRHLLEPSAGRASLLDNHKNKYHNADVCEISFDNQAILRSKGYNVVAHDFLSFSTPKEYSAIIMNPPFRNAISHVMHAWNNILSNGQIVAVVNAETIRNPNDKNKKILVRLLEETGNECEFVQAAFLQEDAQRTTSVEVAIISLHKKRDININYSFLNDLKQDDFPQPESDTNSGAPFDLNNSIAIPQSVVERAVTVYNAACRALRREFDISDSLTSTRQYYTDLLERSILQKEEPENCDSQYFYDDQSDVFNKTLSEIKERAWSTVLTQTKIGKSLSSSVMKDLASRFDQVKSLEFTEINVLSFLQGLVAQNSEMQVQMLCDLHESFTTYGFENMVFYKGWKSNDRHRVSFKIRTTRIILPLRRSSYSSSIDYSQMEKFADMDKGMDLLAGLPECTYALSKAIKANEKSGSVRFSAGHFEVRMYSQSIHLYPNDPKLIDRLNIWVGRARSWIPPEVSSTENEDFWKQYTSSHTFQKELISTKSVQRMNIYRLLNPDRHDSQSEIELFNEILEEEAVAKGFQMNFDRLEHTSNQQLTII